ncbi:hypothetical protein [Streptomyces melanogenes]|nr:hypothetical protein [Streptomyces melanogenes]GGP58367.1 hypothetical protein GCM10010278_39160 [Streptomyces melanogenes]
MPIDPFAALNAMLRAEAARIRRPAPATPDREDPEPGEEQHRTPADPHGK